MTERSSSGRNARGMRVAADAEDFGSGLGRLVLALLDLVRQLLERQAMRRVESGSLDDAQTERLGCALMELQDRFDELRDELGCDDTDLRLPFDAEDLLTAGQEESSPTERRFKL